MYMKTSTPGFMYIFFCSVTFTIHWPHSQYTYILLYHICKLYIFNCLYIFHSPCTLSRFSAINIILCPQKRRLTAINSNTISFSKVNNEIEKILIILY